MNASKNAATKPVAPSGRIDEMSSEKALHTIASLNGNDEILNLQRFDFMRLRNAAGKNSGLLAMARSCKMVDNQ
jgi:hypothetical protein